VQPRFEREGHKTDSEALGVAAVAGLAGAGHVAHVVAKTLLVDLDAA